jgi:hypothetical protein
MAEEPDRYKYRYTGIIGRFRFTTFVEVDMVCNVFD